MVVYSASIDWRVVMQVTFSAVQKVGFILDSKMLFHYEGMLPEFYGRYGFEREEEVILMGMKIE